jgi:MFS family permease
VSEFGSQISIVALPFVAIATLHATVFEVALVNVMNFAPLIFFALPAGVYVERLRRRPIMLAADATRAVILASIPIAYAAGDLTIWQLLACCFFNGSFTVLFDVAAQSFLPAIAGREELSDGNAALQMSVQTAQVAGPGLGGLLIGLFAAPFAVVVDALSFVGSAAFIRRIGVAEAVTAPTGRRNAVAELREGLAFVLDHPIMRANLAFTAAANLFNGLLFSVLLVFAVRKLNLSSSQVGIALMLGNLGAVGGAAMAGRLQRKFGIGRVMLTAAFAGWALLLIPIASGPYRLLILAAGLFGWGVGVVLYSISSVTILQATTPDSLMARANAMRRLTSWGALPLGALAGGALGASLGLQTAVVVGAGGRALAGVLLLASPVRGIRTLEDADELVRDADANLATGG